MQNHVEKREKEISAIPWTNPGVHPPATPRIESRWGHPEEVAVQGWGGKLGQEEWGEVVAVSGEKRLAPAREPRSGPESVSPRRPPSAGLRWEKKKNNTIQNRPLRLVGAWKGWGARGEYFRMKFWAESASSPRHVKSCAGLKRKENGRDRTPKREGDEAVGSFAWKGTERTTVKMDLGVRLRETHSMVGRTRWRPSLIVHSLPTVLKKQKSYLIAELRSHSTMRLGCLSDRTLCRTSLSTTPPLSSRHLHRVRAPQPIFLSLHHAFHSPQPSRVRGPATVFSTGPVAVFSTRMVSSTPVSSTQFPNSKEILHWKCMLQTYVSDICCKCFILVL
jgi:hypothetical protein